MDLAKFHYLHALQICLHLIRFVIFISQSQDLGHHSSDVGGGHGGARERGSALIGSGGDDIYTLQWRAQANEVKLKLLSYPVP